MKLAVGLSVLTRYVTACMLIASLVACSATTGQPQGGAMSGRHGLQGLDERQIAAVQKARGSGAAFYVVVPSASNPLSNALIVGWSKLSADSSAVEAIHAALNSHKVEDVGVIGLSPRVNVAVVKAAVASARSVVGRKRLYVFVGDQEPGVIEAPRSDVEVYWVRADGTLR